jgi:hypothetical protein
MAKKPRARTERRQRERAARQLVRDQQRLAALEPGGAPDRPIPVPSSSVIPVRARAQPCPLCGGSLRLDDETAESATLRATHMSCMRCGVARRLWFVISGPPLPN